MRDIVLLVEDDNTLVGAWVNSLNDSMKTEYRLDLEVHLSIQSLDDMIKSNQALNARIAIVDMWMNNKKNNVHDPKAGYKAIQLIRNKWPKCFIIVYSAHLRREIEDELARSYSNITFIPKTMPQTVVLREIDRAIAKGQV